MLGIGGTYLCCPYVVLVVASHFLGSRGQMNQDTINIHGPKDDGTYVVEFEKANGEVLTIPVHGSETAILRHFQAKMPRGLVVPERSSQE
jgi:hypothetical protein